MDEEQSGGFIWEAWGHGTHPGGGPQSGGHGRHPGGHGTHPGGRIFLPGLGVLALTLPDRLTGCLTEAEAKAIAVAELEFARGVYLLAAKTYDRAIDILSAPTGRPEKE